MLEILSLVINLTLAIINVVIIIRQHAVLLTLKNLSLSQERILNKVVHIDDSIKINLPSDMKDVTFGAHAGVDPDESDFPDLQSVGDVSEIGEPVSGAFQIITQEDIENARRSYKSKASTTASDSDFDD